MGRYRRKAPTRSPKPRIVVATEGKVTEPRYLKLFHQVHGAPSVSVDPIGIGGGNPRTVVERALSERKKCKSDPDARDDSFWAMFDRDEHSRFNEAIQFAKDHDISTAISNPCFELWAILHYEMRDASSHHRDCQKRLRQLCPAYASGKGKQFQDEERIRESHGDAVRRARQLVARRREEGDPHGNPSTTVQELTEHIKMRS